MFFHFPKHVLKLVGLYCLWRLVLLFWMERVGLPRRLLPLKLLPYLIHNTCWMYLNHTSHNHQFTKWMNYAHDQQCSKENFVVICASAMKFLLAIPPADLGSIKVVNYTYIVNYTYSKYKQYIQYTYSRCNKHAIYIQQTVYTVHTQHTVQHAYCTVCKNQDF